MHLHKYENYGSHSEWLLVLFLIVIAFGAFWKGTSLKSYGTIDQQTLKHMTHLSLKILVQEVGEGKYIVNMVASAFSYI